jgi:hypothetical protein
MSEVTLKQRLTRQLGTVRPNHEQQLVLQAIFAQPERAREAYLAWRGTLDIEQPFDAVVMRLLPLIPNFIRYRLGIVSWRGWLRNQLWRMKQGLRQALG